MIRKIMRYIGVLHDVKASEKSIAAGTAHTHTRVHTHTHTAAAGITHTHTRTRTHTGAHLPNQLEPTMATFSSSSGSLQIHCIDKTIGTCAADICI